MRAAPALLALLLLAGCVESGPSATSTPTSAPTTDGPTTDATNPTATATTSPTGASTPSEETRLPMLLVERTFQPAEGKFHLYDRVQHCPSIGRTQQGPWSMRLDPGDATPAAGMREEWNLTAIRWAAATGTARGLPLAGPQDLPLPATFGSQQFTGLSFDGKAFLLDGAPLQDGAQRTLAYTAVDDEGRSVGITETVTLHPFPDAAVTIERPSSHHCI